jgi:hypothetical protein
MNGGVVKPHLIEDTNSYEYPRARNEQTTGRQRVGIPHTYTSASITMLSMSVTYMDPVSPTIMQKTIAGPITTTIPFSSNLTLGGTPMVLSFDMDMANSIAIDGMGNVTVTPAFRTIMNAVGAGSGHDPENGALEQMTGSVASASGNSFDFSMMQSAQVLNFATRPACVSGIRFWCRPRWRR